MPDELLSTEPPFDGLEFVFPAVLAEIAAVMASPAVLLGVAEGLVRPIPEDGADLVVDVVVDVLEAQQQVPLQVQPVVVGVAAVDGDASEEPWGAQSNASGLAGVGYRGQAGTGA